MKLSHEIGHWVGKAFLRLTGWRVQGKMPENTPRAVIIAAPHTTNWDFVYLLATAMELRVPIYWLGKQSLFKAPFGSIMRALGGIAVDRSQTNNLVEQVATRIRNSESMAVVIPPSGTRGKAPYWRSGFYWIAHSAGATVVCGYLDYPKKLAGLGYSFKPSGAVSADMDPVRTFYEPIVGKFPDQTTPVLLKEELPEEGADRL